MDTLQIAILLFDGITALDAVGPYEVLSRLPGAQVVFVATVPGPKRTGNQALALVADRSLDDVSRPDLLLIPGGAGARTLVEDAAVLAWIRQAHATSRWTTSVCTGALLLGAAGVLRGLEATTHWLSLDLLAEYGARPVQRRVVEQGKVITSAGVSAGIDMALTLAAREVVEQVARGIQLSIEYDPQPPFDSGSAVDASPELVAWVRDRPQPPAAATASRPAQLDR